MLKQFLRKVLAKKTEEPVWEDKQEKENPGFPPTGTLLITKEKILLGMYRDVVEIVKESFNKGGILRLALEDDLLLGPTTEISCSLQEFIFNIEREAPQLLVLLDWKDPSTKYIFSHALLPQNKEEQIFFVQQRVLSIYNACELIEKDYREVTESFVGALGLYLDDDFFVEFEKWVQERSQDSLLEEREMEPIPIRLQISREEVERMEIGKIARVMETLLENPQWAKEKKGSILFSFYGFSGNLEDLLHNPEVQSWARFLVEKYPYLFYFLNDGEAPMTSFLASLVVSSQRAFQSQIK